MLIDTDIFNAHASIEVVLDGNMIFVKELKNIR
jgi:hypothetical protein